jgi:hypothetical protein
MVSESVTRGKLSQSIPQAAFATTLGLLPLVASAATFVTFSFGTVAFDEVVSFFFGGVCLLSTDGASGPAAFSQFENFTGTLPVLVFTVQRLTCGSCHFAWSFSSNGQLR